MTCGTLNTKKNTTEKQNSEVLLTFKAQLTWQLHFETSSEKLLWPSSKILAFFLRNLADETDKQKKRLAVL